MAWDFQQCGMCDQQSLRSACAYAQYDTRYKIQETLFKVGFHKQITLATRAIFRQTRV